MRGKPKIHGETTPNSDYHISSVLITGLEGSLHFPLLSVKENEMSRAFTNDIVGGEIILDQYAVEDLVQFQGTTFKVPEYQH